MLVESGVHALQDANDPTSSLYLPAGHMTQAPAAPPLDETEVIVPSKPTLQRQSDAAALADVLCELPGQSAQAASPSSLLNVLEGQEEHEPLAEDVPDIKPV